MRNTVLNRLTPQNRKTSIAALSILLSFIILSAAVPHAWTTTTTTFSGRAFVLSVTAPVVGTLTFADTGQLPPQGGERDATLLSVSTAQAQGIVLLSVTKGFDQTAESEASVAFVSLLPGTPNQVSADFVRSNTEATCNGVVGGSEIANLVVAGQNIVVTGQPNQTISIPGVLTLVINEQINSSSGGTNSITVNALHLTTVGGTEVIVSSAHSDITCAPPPPPPHVQKDFMTGGGYILNNGQHANFGFVAGFKPGRTSPDGQLTYLDHGTGMKVKGTVTSYSGSGSTRTFGGPAEVNGATGCNFSVTATDNGEPGKGRDTFSISIDCNGYTASGTLAGGNIKLHT
ncbi:MAG: hypothetical protein E6K84_03620 [Thaumarchaeota archaeon]|nr:MAG: hypothetical protein E6K84_03620 [Nitrososphaerota archaeon]